VCKRLHTVANKAKVQTIRQDAKKHSAHVFVGLSALLEAVALLDVWSGCLDGWMLGIDQKVLLSS